MALTAAQFLANNNLGGTISEAQIATILAVESPLFYTEMGVSEDALTTQQQAVAAHFLSQLVWQALRFPSATADEQQT